MLLLRHSCAHLLFTLPRCMYIPVSSLSRTLFLSFFLPSIFSLLASIISLCVCHTTQVVLISATMPHDVLEMTTKFMQDPVRILVKRDELTLEGIKQFFVAVEKEVCWGHSGETEGDTDRRQL